MKKKSLFLMVGLLGATVALSGCVTKNNKPTNTSTDVISSTDEEKPNDEIYEIYKLAKKSGYTGTYEEWLASIKGDSVELRVESGNIEWKYKQDTAWTTLISLQELAGKDGTDGKKVELSTNSTHILWRYEGETEWNNLLEIPVVSNGKSAYEIAQEVGFEGTKEEWIASLNGRGIKSIVKTATDGNVDTYTITFTDDTTFDFQITNANQPAEEEIPEELYGFSFNEILGYGYGVLSIYNPSDTVVIPSEYKNKPVLTIEKSAIQSKDVESIIIPSSIAFVKDYAIQCDNLQSVYYDGTLESWDQIFGGESIDCSDGYSLFIADDNGAYTKNGKNYSLISDITVSSQDDVDSYASVSSISSITLTGDVVGEEIDLSYLENLDNIYFDGDIESWFDIEFYDRSSFKNLYVLDESGDVEHDGKTYRLVSCLEVPADFDYANSLGYYIPNDPIDGVIINDMNVLSDYFDSYNLNYDYFNILTTKDVYTLSDVSSDLSDRIYVKDEFGSFEFNGDKYFSYYELSPVSSANYYASYNNASCVWDPITLEEANYDVSGDLDVWLVNSNNYNTTYNGLYGAEYQNPFDGLTYQVGDTLPAWKDFAKKLNLTNINQSISAKVNDNNSYNMLRQSLDNLGNYVDENGNKVDLFYNTTSNLNQLADNGKLVNLLPYIEAGQMPALSRFLDNNPSIKNELIHNDALYYTPFFDGYQQIERSFIMDTKLVEKLLDEVLPEGTGQLVSGVSATNDKVITGEASAQPFISGVYNYPKEMTIGILDKDLSKKQVVVHQTDNIINLQNDLLNTSDGSCTGEALINQFKEYAREAYGDIIDTYCDGKISGIFTSASACYNADDLVALLRLFKANPDVLYGSSTAFDEVVPVFARQHTDNRIVNILQFGATLYGVQGAGSEVDKLFFGADGKLHDFETQSASFELLEKLHALYTEGLIEEEFWSGEIPGNPADRYFGKTVANPTFGLLEYDYIATQSNYNDAVNGIGTKNTSRKTSESGFDFSEIEVTGIKPILSPLTYVSTVSYSYQQGLDDTYGKTLCRYYEENRTLKSTSWAIPYSSDNIDAAIALMDLMFTKEGHITQNYGTSEYWTSTDFENTPTLRPELFASIPSGDSWTYFRAAMGTTFGVGHLRPIDLDLQTANEYAKDSYRTIIAAREAGIQLSSSMDLPIITWNSSIPTKAKAVSISAEVSNEYSNLTAFWTQAYKKAAQPYGWVYVIVNGMYDDISISNSTITNYSELINQTPNKNHTYLYEIASYLGSEFIPDEAVI